MEKLTGEALIDQIERDEFAFAHRENRIPLQRYARAATAEIKDHWQWEVIATRIRAANAREYYEWLARTR